jgi:hypothetical protein
MNIEVVKIIFLFENIEDKNNFHIAHNKSFEVLPRLVVYSLCCDIAKLSENSFKLEYDILLKPGKSFSDLKIEKFLKSMPNFSEIKLQIYERDISDPSKPETSTPVPVQNTQKVYSDYRGPDRPKHWAAKSCKENWDAKTRAWRMENDRLGR